MRLVAVAPNPSIDRFFAVGRLQLGTTNRASLELRVAGGKGLNVARAAAAMGVDVGAVAILAGHSGRWIVDELAGDGVQGTYVWVDGETRTCLAIYEATEGTLTELNEAGPTIAAAAWPDLLEALETQLTADNVGLVTISGSLPPGAPIDGVALLVEVARAAGVRTIVDSSGEPLLRALETRPWIVKLNSHEAATTAQMARTGQLYTGEMPENDEATAASLAQALAERIDGPAIVTRGPDGAVVARPNEPTLRIVLPGVRGRYPVGSGDAFLAGLAAAVLAGQEFEVALRLAMGAAAANALVPGPGRLDPGDAARLARSVEVASL